MTDKQLKALTGYNGDARELIDSVESMLEEQGLENTYTVEGLAEAGCIEVADDGHGLVVIDTNGGLIGADWLENEQGEPVMTNDRTSDVDIMLPCPIIGQVCDHPATCNCSICDRLLLNARIAKQRRSMLSNESDSNLSKTQRKERTNEQMS